MEKKWLKLLITGISRNSEDILVVVFILGALFIFGSKRNDASFEAKKTLRFLLGSLRSKILETKAAKNKTEPKNCENKSQKPQNFIQQNTGPNLFKKLAFLVTSWFSSSIKLSHQKGEMFKGIVSRKFAMLLLVPLES
jgi:hypothetical protein